VNDLHQGDGGKGCIVFWPSPASLQPPWSFISRLVTLKGFLMLVLSDAQASDYQKNFAFRMLRETSRKKWKYSRFFDRSGPHHLSTVASAARLASFGLWPEELGMHIKNKLFI
jgi:hypothetical protein